MSEQHKPPERTSDERQDDYVRLLRSLNPGVVFDSSGRPLKDRRVDPKPIIFPGEDK